MSLWNQDQNPLPPEYAYLRLLSSDPMLLVTPGTYYRVAGIYQLWNKAGFTIDVDGVITYTGKGGDFMVVGMSDIEVNKDCTINYGTRVNGQIAGVTNHVFYALGRMGPINSTVIFSLHTGDEVEFWAASDTANTTFQSLTAKVSFYGHET